MSTIFTDRKGRSWDVALDLLKASRIDKSDFKEYWDKEFSILDLDKLLIQKLLNDPAFLFALIWVVVQDQLPDSFPKEQDAAQAEFVSGVNGPTIEAARSAFLEALADFFPDQRTVLSILKDQNTTLHQKAATKLLETVPLLNDLLDEEFNERVTALMEELKTRDKTLGVTSMPSLETSVSASETSGVPASQLSS